MKIKKTPVKKLAVPPLAIRNLIKSLKECPDTEIATHIDATPEWIWPRGDLFHWVAVLNRFDDILDTLCKAHDMKKAQPKEFSEENRRLILAILGFSRMLLENCTNRNLYASYEQLNDLLHSRDLDILESCLRLLLRPAQRHSAQRTAKSIFTVSQDRLLALTHPWGNKEHGQDLLQLVDENAVIPERLTDLNFQFYRTISLITPVVDASATSSATTSSTGATGVSSGNLHTVSPLASSPTKQRRSSQSGSSSSTSAATAAASACEGIVVIHATNISRLGSSDYEILAHFVKEYQIPEEHQFSLLNRIRVATAINNTQRRRQLLIIRILAIAVMSHVLPETVVVDKFFAFEPEIIQSLTELIHPDHKTPYALQTVALFALDGLAHLRNKQVDVLTAVNASASHGVLLYMLRKTVNGLDSENSALPQDFLDAVFAFISFLAGSQSGGSMLISAGIVPVILKLLNNKHASQLKNVTKAVSLLDNLVYGFGTAFTSFCSSDGLNTLVARIKDEVELSLNLVKEAESSQMSDVASTSSSNEASPIPFERTALLKAMFKFVLHMMQSPGTQEGLRNLIDTTLPTTLKIIMENFEVLGTAVYAHAINTMASFIHNEPTSLTILQDAKIPQTLLASLSKAIPASTDVAMSIPGAFGAICLNPAGLEMFNKDFKLKTFFSIFTSPRHILAFQDSDIASNLGLSVDELVRHQPSLKSALMNEIIAMLEEVLDLNSTQRISAEDMTHCTLQKTRSKDAPPPGETIDEDSTKDDKKESLVPMMIEGASRFCESFFQNASSAKDFLKAGGIDILMRFYSLETFPYDLASTPAFLTLSYLIKMLSETNPADAVTAVIKETIKLLNNVKPLLESTNAGSDLIKYIDISESSEAEIEQGNRTLRSLISLYGLSGLLSDMFCAPAFSHGRNSASVLAAFVDAEGDKALSGLGQLHRMCVWETVAMKRVLQKNWSDPNPKAKKPQNPVPVPGTIDFVVEELAKDDKEPDTPAITDMHSPTIVNTKYFNFVLTQTPHCITPMYQGMTKVLFNRRDMESTQRTNAFKVADAVSKVLQSHVSWERPSKSNIAADKHTYLTTMLRLLPFLMLDDRNPPTLQTVLVASFVRTGGLQTLFTTLDSVLQELNTETSTDDKSKLYATIEVILSVLQTITSSKLLHDSSHTSTLTSRDSGSRRNDFFDPHEFLVDVRLVILPKVKALWLDPILNSCPTTLVRQLIQTLINILKAEGELKPEAPPGPSIILGGAPNLFGARPLVADAASVSTLVDMGFPRAAAELALTRCGNQLERAAEFLLTNSDIVAAAVYDQEREATAARAAAASSTPTTDQAAGGSSGPSTEGVAPAGESAVANTAEGAAPADEDEEMLHQALEMSVSGGDSATTNAAEGSSSTTTNRASPKASEPVSDAETHKARKEELAKAREELKPLLVSRSLELITLVDGVIFSVRDILLFLCKDKDNKILDELVDITVSAGEKLDETDKEKTKSSGEFFGSHLRLLALLFSDISIQPKMGDYAQKLLPQLMSTLKKAVDSPIPQKENNWLSPLLLMIEGFVSISDEPKVVEDEASAEGRAKAAQQDLEMTSPIVSRSNMEILLQHSISLLKQDELSKDVMLSVFRILVRLTRHHSLAVEFLKCEGLPLMFATLKPDKLGVQGQQSLIVMIMRHIIEDTYVLQEAMEREISKWFSQPTRPRSSDIQSYLRHNNYLGLRDLDAFVAGTLKACKVSKHDTAYRVLYLSLTKLVTPPKTESKDEQEAAKEDKDEDMDKEKENENEKENTDEPIAEEIGSSSTSAAAISTAITEATKRYSSEVSEAVISFLVTEMLNCRSVISTPEQSTAPTAAGESSGKTDTAATSATRDGAEKTTPSTEVSMDPEFIHQCFILQCLNELLVSYPMCKIDLMNYSRRKGSKDSLHTASKPRANWLNYFLSDLIPYRNSAGQASNTDMRKQSVKSSFGSGVLVALCSNNDEEEEKSSNELVQVRRFVVDGLTRAFRDAIASTESIEAKYGRFLSLSELSYKILTATPAPGSVQKTNDDISINIVKVMLEKNFIMTLTNVVADIDLNYPHAKVLVNAVLKPLEHLTKLSLKMSRASDSGAPKPRRRSTPLSGQGSGAGSGDDAPDLYRNSSLGMFDGTNIESEEDNESGDSISDEDMFEGEEFGEETASDASDLSEDDLSDDDDEEGQEEEELVRNPFHDDHEATEEDDEDQDDVELMDGDGDDDDDDDDDDEDDDIDAEIQEAHDRDEEDGENMVMEWGGNGHGPVMLDDDDIAEVIDDDDDDDGEEDSDDDDNHGRFVEDHDRAHHHHHHHHHHHSGDDGTEDEDDEGDDDDEDASEDDEDDGMDGDEDDDGLADLEDDGEPPRRHNRHNPWNMTSTFVINENALRNGRPLFEPQGRRGRLPGQERGFIWDDVGADQGRFSYLQDDDLPILRAPARNPFLQVSDDAITHPLLAQPANPPTANHNAGHRARSNAHGIGLTDWQTFEELLQGNAQQVIGTLLNGGALRAGHGGAFRVEVNNDRSTTLIPLDRPGGHHHHHHHHAHHGIHGDTLRATISIEGGSGETAGQKNNMFSIVHDFVPFSTSQRWSQECRMMYGATAQDKASRIQNHIINAFIPAAKEEARLKLDREHKEMEQRRKVDAERRRVADEKRKADEEKRKAEEEARRKKEQEEELARIAEEQAANEREAARRAEEAAARVARGEPEHEETPMEVEGSSAATSAALTAPSGQAAPARRMVMIDGEEVDITDSDIDAEFLEALPDHMRREVYNDYLQLHRPPTTSTQSGSSNNNINNSNNASSSSNSNNINDDFLNVLPQELREELDELIRGPRPAAAAPVRGPSQVPSAPIPGAAPLLSRLAPQLRLMQEDRSLRAFSASLMAETRALLERFPADLMGATAARERLVGDAARPNNASSTKKTTVQREAIQLVDKSSLATLVRLMFLPQPLSRNILNKLLVNLCENSKTRADLLSLLLSILQDGGADLAAVDRSFAPLRGKPVAKAPNQPKGAKGSASVQASMDNVPNLVARRCFESLHYIVSLNEQASLFFLSEHENVILKRPTKKGKGKEKVISSKYPIVLLLDLLERPIFVQNSALMEQLMSLLWIICRPLATLVKPADSKPEEEEEKEKEKGKEKASESATEPGAADSAPSDSATPSAPSTEVIASSAEAPAATAADDKADTKPTEPEFQPPVIPDHCLQLVVRVLTAGECSGRTFQYTLSVIQNLSLLTGARDIITSELIGAARDLGAGVLESLDELSQTLENAMSGVDVQGMALEKFSPASSKQAKLLRVLKTVDYMYSRKQTTPTPAARQLNIELAPTMDPEEADAVLPRSMRDMNNEALNLNKDEQKATEIYDSLKFNMLWTKVGNTLEMIHERSDMIHVATVLLPLIESFMVVCKYVGLRPSTLEVDEEESKKAKHDSTEDLFLQFTEKHSKILNIMVRNNPALMSGSFSLLVHNPKMLEFDNKRNYFAQQLHKRNATRDHYGSLQMNVRREMVFMDSYSHWQSRSGDEIKYSKLNVKFHGEEGVDGGGVTREWFQVLARQMFNPDYALFKTSAADKLTYQPNRASWANPDHLLYFKFIGRVIGKAIYDGRLLDAYFTRSFYKHILGRPVDYRDVEAVDPEYYKSLVWMLENDITDIVDETFSVETDDFGNTKIVDLKPNGRNIPVTEENKHEYVKFITEQKLTLAIKDQIHSFLLGFHEIIPAHLISIFNEQELELLISGLPDIDIDEWKNNAEYQNYTQASPQIQNFWRAVRSFDQTERAKLLQFVTGTSKVPLGGFSQLQGISGIQKFQIHKDFSSTKRLPSAHTCFNQLDLPEYESYEELRQQLLVAISECSTGFAFA
ncbi:hypothetical protein BGX26_008924 [Mortierella sp. AD094]|nr:hypothetical protein BGX26_008924 [Mortierella sp. AD094]